MESGEKIEEARNLFLVRAFYFCAVMAATFIIASKLLAPSPDVRRSLSSAHFTLVEMAGDGLYREVSR